MNSVRTFDTKVTSIIARLPSSLKRPFELLGLATSPLIWFIAVILAAIFARSPEYTPYVLTLLAMPLASVIKFAFRRQRPPTIYAGNMRIKSYSFPSSHSYSSALGCSFLIGLILLADIPAILALVPVTALSIIAITVGVSRIYVGAHYPSDVLAGLLMGVVVGAGILLWS